MKNKETLIRVYVIYFVVLLLGGGIIFQIFYLQFYKGAELVQYAEKQRSLSLLPISKLSVKTASNQQQLGTLCLISKTTWNNCIHSSGKSKES